MRLFLLLFSLCLFWAVQSQSVYFSNFSQGASDWLRPLGAGGAQWNTTTNMGFTDNVSLFMQNNSQGSGTVSTVSPSFSLTAGVRYSFSWASRALQASNGENLSVRLVRNTPQGGSVVVQDIMLNNTLTGTSWTQQSFQFIATSTSNQYALQFLTQAVANRSGPVIDDVSVARICNSVPAAGSAVASAASVCLNGSVTLSLSGATDSVGLVYQWQQRPTGNGQWQNITGAVQRTFTATGLQQSTEYRCQVSCSGVGSAVVSTPAQVAVGVPVNDLRCNALPIAAGTQWVEGNNSCATISGLGESWGSNNMWYKFTAPASRNYNLVIKTPAGGEKIKQARIRIYSSVNGDCNTVNNAAQVGSEINFTFSTASYDSVGVATTGNFTAGVTYFIAVASQNSTSAGQFRLKLSSLPLLPCPVLVSPAANATGIPRDAAFQWNAVQGALRYQVISTTGLSPVAFNVVATTDATSIHQMRASNAQPEWTVRAENADFTSVNCATQTFRVENNLANNSNYCYHADTLSVARSAILNSNSLLSQSIAPVFCNPRKTPPAAARDVWYAIKPAELGTLHLFSRAFIGSEQVDPVLQLYTGTCDQPIPIICADQNSINGFERISYNLTDINQRLWVRVYNAGNAPDNFETRLGAPDTCSLLVTQFTAPIGGATQYQWQVNTGSGFVNITDNAVYRGTQSPLLTVRNPPTNFRGYTYRCVANTTTGQLTTTPEILPMVALWTGSAGSNWSNPANWQCGRVPDRFTDVVIGANTPASPQIDVSQEVYSLRLNQGANLQVQPGVHLTILNQQ